MLECHPVFKPLIHEANHVVRHVQHPVHHVRHHVSHLVQHAHRVTPALQQTFTVTTVCKKVAGPLLAGGVALLPPGSSSPAVGGVGGFPSNVPSEYGAPSEIGPGPFWPFPGGYVGPGGFYGGGSGIVSGGYTGPTGLVAANLPTYFASSETPSSFGGGSPANSPPVSGGSSPGASVPAGPSGGSPGISGDAPGGDTGSDGGPGTGPVNRTGGDATPAPEPGSLAILGTAIAGSLAWRAGRRRGKRL